MVVVALGGIDVDKRIAPYLRKRKIPLIYDAAQHHEPKRLDADYVCYSFQAIKTITTADGGVLVLRNEEDYQRTKKLRWFGIDRELKNRNKWQKREMTFDIEEAGYKFQPTDIDACFGLAALPDLDKVLKYRADLADEYRKELSSVKQVKMLQDGSNWLFCILAEDRDNLADFLIKSGIETNLVHLRNDLYKVFGGKKLNLPNMNWVESRYLCLPLNTKVGLVEVKIICDTINLYEKE